MFHTISDFIHTWKAETEKTTVILNALTDESLQMETAPGLRTIGRLVWHLLETPKEMLEKTGLHVEGPEMNSQPVHTVKELKRKHEQVIQSVIHEIESHWQNKTLHIKDNMYGEEWERSFTLTALIFHQIHHRGQLTVFMRLVGLKVPGIYGPAKEEWAALGMEPQD